MEPASSPVGITTRRSSRAVAVAAFAPHWSGCPPTSTETSSARRSCVGSERATVNSETLGERSSARAVSSSAHGCAARTRTPSVSDGPAPFAGSAALPPRVDSPARAPARAAEVDDACLVEDGSHRSVFR